jgi:hypothetical protein
MHHMVNIIPKIEDITIIGSRITSIIASSIRIGSPAAPPYCIFHLRQY